jgi:hypothetical protein
MLVLVRTIFIVVFGEVHMEIGNEHGGFLGLHLTKYECIIHILGSSCMKL